MRYLEPAFRQPACFRRNRFPTRPQLRESEVGSPSKKARSNRPAGVLQSTSPRHQSQVLVELMFAVPNAASLISEGIDSLLDQAVGDLRIQGEPSTDALVTGRRATGLLAKQDARREAGFPPRPIRIVARDSHGPTSMPDIADDFNPAPTAARAQRCSMDPPNTQ